MRRKSKIRIINNRIDLISFTKDVQGLDFKITKSTITLIRRWRRGSAEEECTKTIKRYASTNIVKTLALYRSEGQKDAQRLRLTNKDPKLHKDFIEPLREIGVNEFIAYVYYCYCEKCGQEKLENAVREFEKITGVKVTGRYRNELAHNPVFITDVNSKPLAIFIRHMERMLRKQIAYGNVPKDIATKYIRSIIDGDGSFSIRIKRGKVDGTYLLIFETDNEAITDILTIFERYFSIKLRTYSEGRITNGRQMKSINLDNLLELLLNDLIPDKYLDKVAKRVAIALQRKDTPWILLKLSENFKDKWFSSKEASEILSKSRHHMLERLRKLEEKGYLVSTKKKINNNRIGTPIRRLFRLSEKGRELVEILYSLPLSSSTLFTLSFMLSAFWKSFIIDPSQPSCHWNGGECLCSNLQYSKRPEGYLEKVRRGGLNVGIWNL
ncbi:MAG: PadR family transcriptional regulator [Thermosphaera sp.]